MWEEFGDWTYVSILFSVAPHPQVLTSLPSLVWTDNGVLLWDKTKLCW